MLYPVSYTHLDVYKRQIRVYLKKNHGCFADASHKTALAKNRLFSPFQVNFALKFGGDCGLFFLIKYN